MSMSSQCLKCFLISFFYVLSMFGMEQMAERNYKIAGLPDAVVEVSHALVQKSPPLRREAERNSGPFLKIEIQRRNVLLEGQRNFSDIHHAVALLESLVYMEADQISLVLLALEDEELRTFIWVAQYLSMHSFALTGLKVYVQKYKSDDLITSPASRVPSLVDLVTCELARNVSMEKSGIVFHFCTPEGIRACKIDDLPGYLQLLLFKKIPLTVRNFRTLYSWIEQNSKQNGSKTRADSLNKEKKEEVKPVEFSEEQFAALDSVALFLEDTCGSAKLLFREFRSLDAQDGKVRLELLRSLLHSTQSKLTPKKRLKIGWLLAIEEPSAIKRDAIFHELAFYLFKNPLSRAEVSLFCKEAYPAFFACMEDFNLMPLALKAMLGQLYILAKRISMRTLLFREIVTATIRSPIDRNNALSMERLVEYIEKMLKEIEQKSPDEKGKILEFITQLIDENAFLRGLGNSVPPQGGEKRVFPSASFSYFFEILHFSNLLLAPIEKKEALGRKLINTMKAVVTRGQQLGEDSDDERVAQPYIPLVRLFRRGADPNARDENGDTVAHLVFKHCVTFEMHLVFLGLMCRVGCIFDMNCPNGKGETPTMLMQRLPLNSYNIKLLRFIAQRCNVEFSRDQLMQVARFLIEKKQRPKDVISIPQILKMDEQCGKLRFRTIALILNSSDHKYTLPECVQGAWLLALQEIKQERINAILADLSKIVTLCEWDEKNPIIPSLLCLKGKDQELCLQRITELYLLMRTLKDGKLSLADGMKNQNHRALIELLSFSRCLLPCLHKLESSSYCNKRMLEHARALKTTPLAFDQICECILNGADINYADELGNTVLHYAALYGIMPIARFLVNMFGSALQLNKKNKQGSTPLHMAARGDTIDCLEFFMNSVHSESLDILAKDQNGYIALHYALLHRWGRLLITGQLYKKGNYTPCDCTEGLCSVEHKFLSCA